MEIVDWAYYIAILAILTGLDVLLIHRKIMNEWGRWALFIIILLVANVIIVPLNQGSFETWGTIFVGFLGSLVVHRITLDLTQQREENQKLINRQIKAIEGQFKLWKME